MEKSIVANAIQKYNKSVIYSYGDFLPEFTDAYHCNSNDVTVKEFCKFVLENLMKKVKENDRNPLNMIIIYTNVSDIDDVGILEDYCLSSYEGGHLVEIVVLMKK